MGTPFDGRRIDLRYIREAAREIGAALRDKSGYHVVVVKSTVVPGTTDEVVRPMLEEASGKRAGVDFGVGMNPEFLTEGVAVDDFMEPDRIVLGGIDERTHRRRWPSLRAFPGCRVMRTNNKTAEMIKYASNSAARDADLLLERDRQSLPRPGGVDVADVMTGVHLARLLRSLADGPACSPGHQFVPLGRLRLRRSCLPKD